MNHAANVNDHTMNYVQKEKYFQNNEAWDHFTNKPVFDPRQLPCGHLHSLNGGIKKYLEEHGKCPKCSETFSLANLLVPPLMIRNMIDSFKVAIDF